MKDDSSSKTVILSFITLRRTIGAFAILMPLVLIVGTYTIGGCTQVQDSISHYYYTMMRDVLVGSLCTVAVFLISYNGYSVKDKISSNLAGIFLLTLAFFPTTQNPDATCTVLYLEPNIIRVYIHYGSAALFFITLAYISIFLFTLGPDQKGHRKKVRNKIHRICGTILLLSIVLITLIRVVPVIDETLAPYKPVFWIEWFAMIAFGTSWLIKGEMFYRDMSNGKHKEERL